MADFQDMDFSAARKRVDDLVATHQPSAAYDPADLPDFSEARKKVDAYVASRTPPPSSFWEKAKDTGIALTKGVIGVPEAVVGLVDLAQTPPLYAGQVGRNIARGRPINTPDALSPGLIGRTLQRGIGGVGADFQGAKAILDTWLSAQQREANRRVQEATGLWDTVKTTIRNPSTILQGTVESLPSMGAGGAVGRIVGKAAPALAKATPYLMGAIGEGAITAGQGAEQIRQATPGGATNPKQAALATASGFITGLISAKGGKLAQKLGIADPDTILATGVNPATRRNVVLQLLAGAISEGLIEEAPQSAQEQVAQNIATGKPWFDGVPQSTVQGMLAGAAMGGGANVLSSMARPGPGVTETAPGTPPPAQEQAEAQLDAETEALFRQAEAEQAAQEAQGGVIQPQARQMPDLTPVAPYAVPGGAEPTMPAAELEGIMQGAVGDIRAEQRSADAAQRAERERAALIDLERVKQGVAAERQGLQQQVANVLVNRARGMERAEPASVEQPPVPVQPAPPPAVAEVTPQQGGVTPKPPAITSPATLARAMTANPDMDLTGVKDEWLPVAATKVKGELKAKVQGEIERRKQPAPSAKPPELMTPDEYLASQKLRTAIRYPDGEIVVGNPGEIHAMVAARSGVENKGIPESGWWKDGKYLRPNEAEAIQGQGDARRAQQDARQKHEVALTMAQVNRNPVSAAAVDAYGIKLPPGYVREGDRYVFKGAPAPAQGGGQDVTEQADTEPPRIASTPVEEVNIADIKLSKDVPNFKRDADTETGEVRGQELKGKTYSRLPVNPVTVWERLNGARELITGRHRFALAKRLGEKTIPAQVVREADGFTKEMALTFDAEANIRDNQGSTEDHATYFRNTDISEEEASSRGLLDRDKGRKGWNIGKNASDDLYALYQIGGISDAKADAIARAGKGNADLQSVGIGYAKGHDVDQIIAYMQAVGASKPRGQQLDMFGRDSAWQQEADAIGKAVVEVKNELRAELTALRAAKTAGKEKNAATLKKYGFKAGDVKKVDARIEDLTRLAEEWDRWVTDPNKVAIARERAGLKPIQPAVEQEFKEQGKEEKNEEPVAPPLTLEVQTPAQVKSEREAKEVDEKSLVRHDKEMPKLPKNLQQAYDAGVKARTLGYAGKERQFWTERLYENKHTDIVPNEDSLEQDFWETFFQKGLNGGSQPEYVTGWRYGNIPENKRSTNFRDQKTELGTSLMALHGDDPGGVTYTYKMFNSQGKRVVHVGGWLIGKGSDGEPIVADAEELPANKFRKSGNTYVVGRDAYQLESQIPEKAKSAPAPTPTAPSAQGQPELFAVTEMVKSKDPVKSADAAQEMYGGPAAAVERIKRQLAVIDSDPAQKREFNKDQRAMLKNVVALLEQRAEQESATPQTPDDVIADIHRNFENAAQADLERGLESNKRSVNPLPEDKYELQRLPRVLSYVKAIDYLERYAPWQSVFKTKKAMSAAVRSAPLDYADSRGFKVKPVNPRGNERGNLTGALEVTYDRFTRESVDSWFASLAVKAEQDKQLPSAPPQPGGPGAAAASGTLEFIPRAKEPDGDYTGLRRAISDKERESLGLPEYTVDAVRRFPDIVESVWANMQANPDYAVKLNDELREAPRPVSDSEAATLLILKVQRFNERNAAAQSGDPVRLKEAQAKLESTFDAISRAGTETGRGLNAFKMAMDERFSLVELEQSLRASKGGESATTEELAKLRKVADEYARANRELNDRMAKLSESQTAANEALKAKDEELRNAKMKEEFARLILAKMPPYQASKKPTPRIVEFATARANAARERMKARSGQLFAGVDPQVITDLADIGMEYIVKGAVDLMQFTDRMVKDFGEKVRPYLQDVHAAAMKMLGHEQGRERVEASKRKVPQGDKAPTEQPGYDPATIKELFKDQADMGVTDPQEALTAVHEIIKETNPAMTREQVRDSFSDYGKVKPPSADPVKQTLADWRRQYQLLASIELVAKRLEPLKTGLQRQKPSATVRELTRKLNKMMKEAGINPIDPQTQLASALSGIKSRLENRIEELSKALATGERITLDKNAVPYDEQAKALAAERDELQAMYDQAFPPKPPTYDQQVNLALKAAERNLSALNKRLEDARMGKFTGRPLKPSSVWTAELADLKNQQKAIREEIEQLKEAANPKKSPELLAIEQRRKRDEAVIRELERRIREKDFEPRQSKFIDISGDPEAMAAAERKAKVRAEFAQLKEEARRSKLGKFDKLKEWGIRVYDLSRDTKSSFDVSAPGRQGYPVLFINTKIWANATRAMFKGMRRENSAVLMQRIRERPAYRKGWYRFLALSEDDGMGNYSNVDDRFQLAVINHVPGLAASNRAYAVFLNELRVNLFDYLMEQMPNPQNPSIADLKAVSEDVNIFTGKGKLPGGSAVGASRILYAPSFIKASWDIITGKPMRTGNIPLRNLMARQYAKVLLGTAALVSMASMWGGDDDEGVEYDMTSSDFGTVKFGHYRVGLVSYLRPMLTFMARKIQGYKKVEKNGRIEYVRLTDDVPAWVDESELTAKVPYGGGMDQVDWQFLKSKLHPGISAIRSMISGQDFGGRKIGKAEAVYQMFAPITAEQIREMSKTENIDALVMLTILNAFGFDVRPDYNDPTIKKQLNEERNK